MKEPWKKTSDGEQPQKAANKVVITLNNDETKSEPTEVEVPVDLNWTHHHHRRSERKCSTPKVVVLVGVVLLLGLTVITLFKVQNLIYSTSYINWRMQEIESAVSDSNGDIKLMKFKMSLDDRDEAILRARAEPLIAAPNAKNLDSQDLRLSESQNQNHKLTNSLGGDEAKDMKDTEANNSVEPESKGKEMTGEDGKDHPNPTDPEEWIKPLVETFDILGNQPVEDQFIQNVLMKLLMPENNFEVLEFKKIREGENGVNQELDNQREMMQQQQRQSEEQKKPLPFPIESILMKSLLPPISNFKVFHFNEKPEPQPEENMSQKMMPIQALKMNQMLPPIDSLVKSLLPPTNNMKIFRFNDNNRQPEQSAEEEDMPKITIQSIKLKLIPLPVQDDFGGRRDAPANFLGNQINDNNNFEVIRLNESPEPSQDVEAPKMPLPAQFNPFPIPIQEIMRSILPSNSKHIEIVPLNEKPEDRPMQPQQQERDMDMNQQDKFPLPFLRDLIMKTLLTPPSQNSEEQYSKESQEQQQQQQSPQVEVTKIPVRTMKLNPFPLPIPEALMKPMFPFDAPIHVYEDDEDTEQPEQQQQQQQQPMDHMQMQQQQQLPMDHMQMHQVPQEPHQPMDHMQMPQQQPMDHMQMPQQQPMDHMQMHPVPQEPQQQQQQQLPEVPRPMVRSTKLNPVESWDLSPPPQLPKEPAQQN